MATIELANCSAMLISRRGFDGPLADEGFRQAVLVGNCCAARSGIRAITKNAKLGAQVYHATCDAHGRKEWLEILPEELGAALHHTGEGDRDRFVSSSIATPTLCNAVTGFLPVTAAALLIASPIDGRPFICE
ncbi:hypothetical protein [Mesorhizobium waimense]|uniref:hypothetical protein n=1 Tax=Mesorhizobium waimense TaxID=1300307 RepID=UPI00142D8802|nr:hypothetical protein [Mesorhizobium waimense]